MKKPCETYFGSHQFSDWISYKPEEITLMKPSDIGPQIERGIRVIQHRRCLVCGLEKLRSETK